MNIIKRNKEIAIFDAAKIYNAILKANKEVDDNDQINNETINSIVKIIECQCQTSSTMLEVEEIQNIIEDQLMNINAFKIARKYINYRFSREILRKNNSTDEAILSLIELKNEEVNEENSNKNPTILSVQRDYMAGETSKDLTKRLLLPKHIIDAHEEGIIHFHDTDYFAQHMHNCDLINLEDMLLNGTVINQTFIEKPKSFSTACNIATQIIAQVASSQYGGQTITLSHLAPFVDISRQKIKQNLDKEISLIGVVKIDEEQKNIMVEERLRDEIKKGIQTIQYQINTLMTTNGQTPFVTVFMYLGEVKDIKTKSDLAIIIEETLKQRILGVKNESGVYISPAFPKLIYVLEEDNISEKSKYFYLTELSAKCTAKRLVPDYISEKIMHKFKNGNCYPSMGCRSFLTPYQDKNGNSKFYGRFNQGVVTLNLVDVACASKGNLIEFFKILDSRLELCFEALMFKHKRLIGTKSDVAPILWQHGGISRLKKGEVIDPLLYNNYSTISLGYAGLSEAVFYMLNESHTKSKGMELGLKIMEVLNNKCFYWTNQTSISFSVYGTPLESTTYKFAKCLRKKYGIIENVTDKNYITNSYHINVREQIDAFSKLTIESKFQELSPGGSISYVEVPNLNNNIDVVLELIKHIYNTIMYAEINTKSDYCQVCGYDGEIVIIEDNKKLIWECPNCKNRDQTKMNVARRTCGYIGTQFWNQGRTQEIKDRVLHL